VPLDNRKAAWLLFEWPIHGGIVRPLPILTLTLAMLLWSSSFIALKHVLEVWSFGQVLFMRMGWPPAAGCSATASLAASLPEGGLALAGPDGGA
jgi:hypothetical protein